MKPPSLSSIVAGFKSAVTKNININRNAPGTPVWQRNYYEHIIRNETALNRIYFERPKGYRDRRESFRASHMRLFNWCV